MTLKFDPIKNRFVDEELGIEPGSNIFYGESEPDESTGALGDFYIETESWEIYQKTELGWGDGTPLIGRPGENGINGAPGLNGRDGKDGIDGIDGIDGKDGVDGLDGVNGRNGIDGKSVELRNNKNIIEWRRNGEDWNHLYAMPVQTIGGGGGTRKIGELRDTKITNLTSDQILKYDGTNWINANQVSLTGYVPYTGATQDLNLGAHGLIAHKLLPDATDGLAIYAANGTTQVGNLGPANTANVTWYGSHNFNAATQDTIAAFIGSGKTLGSLTTSTYPSLTELSYVKGVTGSIQTQISGLVPYTGATANLNLGTNNLSFGAVTAGAWNGSLIPLAYGGSNANLTAANGAVVYSTASALALTATPGATGKILLSTNAGAPTWSSALYLQGDGGGGNSDLYLTNYNTRVTANGINVFLGHACGNATLTSTRTTAVGNNAGVALTNGAGNSFFGNICGAGITTGGSNALYGAFIAQTSTAAAMDSSAIFGSSACANGSASQAAIFGGSAAIAATGVGNCVFGYFSGYGLTDGTYNIFLGYQAGRGVTSGSSNILIGYMAGRSYVTTQSNQLYICNSDTATPLIGGVFPNVSLTFTATTTTCSAAFVAGASGFQVGATGTVTAGVWNGSIIPLAYGGSNANLTASNGGIVYSTASAMAILSGTATARKMLQSGASGAPAWSTAVWPATTTINQLLYSSSANTVVGLATANSALLVTNGSGVPSLSTDIPTAVTVGGAYNYRAGGTDVSIADGGTNTSTQTANGVTYYSGSAITSGTAFTTDGLGRVGIGGAIDTTITLYISRAATAGSGALIQQQIGGALGATASNTLSAATYLYLYPNFSVNAGTISDAYGLLVGTGAAGGTITRGYGIYVSNIAYGTTKYGMYINAPTGGTNNYGAYIGGVVGINGAPASSTTLTIGNTAQYGIYMSGTTAVANANHYSMLLQTTSSPTSNSYNSYSVSLNPTFNSGASGINATSGLVVSPTFNGSGTITQYVGIYIDIGSLSGPTLTTAYGIRVDALAVGTTRYGLSVAAQSGGSTNICAQFGGPIKLLTNSTGAGTPLLGTNCPASTLTAPYTWFSFISSDGSTVYVPAWK